MALDHSVVRRLAFIKYLYRTAVSQSHEPSPLNCASLLTMHDAVELFLQLSSEHLNAGSKQPNFMDYWNILNPKLAPNELQQQESMRRLNKARVALKHHGTFPSNLDIESFRADTTNFFLGNTPLVFGVELDDISLIEFVNPESSREKLKDAQNQVQNGDTLDALDNIALAFTEMLADYEERKENDWYESPFFFGKRIATLGFSHQVDEGFVNSVKESIEAMQDAIKMLALGIDYRKYSRFKMFTPRVERYADGNWRIDFRPFEDDDKPQQQDARFCLDFVIEVALVLAEFDYTVDDTK